MFIGRGDLGDEGLRSTLLTLRASRVAVAFLAGAALAVGGVFVQGLFRNPLASPSILGTTAGATLGGQIALIAFGLARDQRGLPLHRARDVSLDRLRGRSARRPGPAPDRGWQAGIS